MFDPTVRSDLEQVYEAALMAMLRNEPPPRPPAGLRVRSPPLPPGLDGPGSRAAFGMPGFGGPISGLAGPRVIAVGAGSQPPGGSIAVGATPEQSTGPGVLGRVAGAYADAVGAAYGPEPLGLSDESARRLGLGDGGRRVVDSIGVPLEFALRGPGAAIMGLPAAMGQALQEAGVSATTANQLVRDASLGLITLPGDGALLRGGVPRPMRPVEPPGPLAAPGQGVALERAPRPPAAEPPRPMVGRAEDLAPVPVVGAPDLGTRLRNLPPSTKSRSAGMTRKSSVPWGRAAEIREATGLDLSGYQHVLDSSGVRHIFKHHGNPRAEEPRGQIAITPDDFAKLPDILATGHVELTKTDMGEAALPYSKRVNGHIFYVEVVRSGKKLLAPKSMCKRKNSPSPSR